MKKELYLGLGVILSAVIIAGGIIYFTSRQIQPIQNENIAGNQALVGNDKDDHGCIGSAGYTWCEPKNKCLRVWEEKCYAGPEQEIQYALADKYGKNIEDVVVKSTKKNDDFMVGSVSFAAKNLPAGGPGGLFMAARQGNMWVLVYDGNGSIDCQRIKDQYDFPKDMLAGYCD